MKAVTAFAPATVANVGVGFDVLGFAVEGPGDRVRAEPDPDNNRVTLVSCTGPEDLPQDAEHNTAGVAATALHRAASPGFGFRLYVEKGIPVGSGLGGSAASAVAAVVAAAGLLEDPPEHDELLQFALEGEAAAGGFPHADNVAPCLYGGLTAAVPGPPLNVCRWPVPDGWRAVIVRPHTRIDTRGARTVLGSSVALADYALGLGRLAGFLAGCRTGDEALVRSSLADHVIEPQRAAPIPGFSAMQEAALDAGAMGCSISGSGPAVFALTASETEAVEVERAMSTALDELAVTHDRFITRVGGAGAALES